MQSTIVCEKCHSPNQATAKFCMACGASLKKTSPTLLKQRYHILTTVGQGGFGAIYQAEDTHLPNLPKRAVKEMLLQSSDPHEQQQAVAAFKQEAVLLAGLMHPNLPRIYEYFEEGGRWYLVMDFIEGKTLEAAVQAAPGGKLSLQRVFHIALQLCTVLDYLHSQRPPIIFRDLKPENVMMTEGDHLYLIDFGIARLFKPGQARDTLALGSPGYAAPEQYGRAQTTARADMYSLGATLHYLLSGHDPSEKPFQFPALNLDQYAPVGPALAALVMQMVEISEEKRPASVKNIKQKLQRLSQQPVTGTPQQASTASQANRAALSNTALLAASSGEITASLVATFIHEGGDFANVMNAIAWSPDSRSLASCSLRSGAIAIWDARTGQQRVSLPRPGWDLAWSADGRRIFSASSTSVRVWDATTGAEIRILDVHLHENFYLKNIVLSPDERYVVVAARNNITSKGQIQTIDVISGEPILTYFGHKTQYIESIACIPGSRSIISVGGEDGTAQIWDGLTGGDAIVISPGRFSSIMKAAPSPDGQRIALLSSRTMSVWEAKTEKLLATAEYRDGSINDLAWSPDGRYLATGGGGIQITDNQEAQIWDASTGKCILEYDREAKDIHDDINIVAWSPDGRYIALGSRSGRVQVWDVENPLKYRLRRW